MTTHRPTAAVQESFGQAQQQAAAMAGPPTAWKPAGRRSSLWIGFAAASVVAGGAAGWLGVEWLGGSNQAAPARAGSGGGTASTSAGRAHAAAHATVSVASPTTSPGGSANAAAGSDGSATAPTSIAASVGPSPSTSLPALATAPSITITREGSSIRIDSANASLAEAVHALAQATHTRVKGGEALVAIAAPVSLKWQGTDTAAAWDALLGRYASIAVSCGATACDLWIVGIDAQRAAGGSALGGSPANGSAAVNGVASTMREAAVLPPRPEVPVPGHTETPAQQPGSEENTETN